MRTQIATGLALLLAAAGGASAAKKDTCFECHTVMEGMSITFQSDIHYKNGVSCADCHGGDQNEEDQNISMSAAKGFKVRVTRNEASEYCARCHSDAAFMQKHNAKQRVDQLALYSKSVHAGKPAGSDSVAANCIDCHGVHNIRAVDDPRSAVGPQRMARTCGKCHADSSDAFQKSAHAPVFTTKESSACSTCHESHGTSRATGDLLAGGRSACMKCHEPDSKEGRTAAAMGRTFENAMAEVFNSNMTAGPGARAPQDQKQMFGMMAAVNARLRNARSLVHGLDNNPVKAAAKAAVTGNQ
jgi:predicted CXXCH cytochrome family protein